MTTTNKLPTTTSNMSRLRLFQPTCKPVFIKDEVQETEWGSVSILGQLGQQHQNVLEAILYYAERVTLNENGVPIKALIDPAKIISAANLSNKNQLLKVAKELVACAITIKKHKLGEHSFKTSPLITFLGEAETKNGNKVSIKDERAILKNTKIGERVFWKVEFGQVLQELLILDFGITRNPKPISGMNDGTRQAAARHMLTHDKKKSKGILVDTMIKIIAGNIHKMALSRARKSLKTANQDFKKVGLCVKGDSIQFA